MISGCAGFAFDVSREMELLRSKPLSVAAGTSNSKAAALEVGKSRRVALTGPSRRHLRCDTGEIAEPGQHSRLSAATGARSPGRTTLRVSLDQPAWIDLVSEGRALESTRHTASRDCPQLYQSVELTVEPGLPLLLQLGNSNAASLGVVVTLL